MKTTSIGLRIRFANALTATVSPRGGVTWDPTGSGRHKVFANAGRYYSNVFDSVFGFADSRPLTDITYTVRNPNANLVGDDVVRSIQHFVIDNLKNPYLNHFSAGYETLLTQDLKVGLTGIVRRGFNQPSSDVVSLSAIEVNQVQRTAGRLRYNGSVLVVAEREVEFHVGKRRAADGQGLDDAVEGLVGLHPVRAGALADLAELALDALAILQRLFLLCHVDDAPLQSTGE